MFLMWQSQEKRVLITRFYKIWKEHTGLFNELEGDFLKWNKLERKFDYFLKFSSFQFNSWYNTIPLAFDKWFIFKI